MWNILQIILSQLMKCEWIVNFATNMYSKVNINIMNSNFEINWNTMWLVTLNSIWIATN